ncbi:hypothetical protein OH799_01430 [Nocardia sp. NBC_00881]|uniref:hypothetical protein n=1 Tax=Nocardia sp. NBC_00881 TaxID=2975995 RepID=UPI0038701ADC|nr:hypothetical protein OH799_01430 [Nocardia sp. NBC_00881]
MTTRIQPAATAETVAAARLLLTQMGISPADLVTAGAAVPTFGEVIPNLRARLSAGTLRTYNTHLEHLLDRWRDHRLDEPTKTDLDELARIIQATARTNRTSWRQCGGAFHQRGAMRVPVCRGQRLDPSLRQPRPPTHHARTPPVAQVCDPLGPARGDLPGRGHHRQRPRPRRR